MSDLKLIVDRLNGEPFYLRLSLVSLDEKQPIQLLQIVNDVFAHLEPTQMRDIRDEPREAMGNRMIAFITALNYKHNLEPNNFKDLFLEGSKSVVFPLLQCIVVSFCFIDNFSGLLTRLPDLRKRLYLVRYLGDVPVSEDCANDETIVELVSQLRQLQAEFKETHKASEKLRSTKVNPIEMQKELEQLDIEKEQLKSKLGKFQSRLKTEAENANFQKILTVTSALRKEQEEEHALAEKTSEQNSQLFYSNQVLLLTEKRYSEFEAFERSHSDPLSMLSKLKSDLSTNKQRLSNLPNEITERSKTCNELEHSLSITAYTDEQFDRLGRMISEHQDKIEKLKAEQLKLAESSKENLAFYSTPAAKVSKQKAKIEQDVAELEEEKIQMENELRETEKQISSLRATLSMSGAVDTAALALKVEKYRSYKAVLQDLSNEISTLLRTVAILSSRNENQEKYLEEMEKEKGISGYSATSASLAQLATVKQKIDQNKERTLDEISKLVLDITNQIAAKRDKLSPVVKDLRSLRAKFSETEAIYLEQKKTYENISIGLESENIKLRQEVEINTSSLLQEESRYHTLQAQLTLKQASLDRLTRETKYLNSASRLSKEFKSYSDMIEKKLSESDNTMKTLRDKQSNSKASHSNNVQQVDKCKSLTKLMNLKLKSVENLAKQNEQDQQEHNFMKIEE